MVRPFGVVEVIETESAQRIPFQPVFLYRICTCLAQAIVSDIDLFESGIHLSEKVIEIALGNRTRSGLQAGPSFEKLRPDGVSGRRHRETHS
jgi:hypothetical protein